MITAISPLDGRYSEKVKELSAFFSEAALVRSRIAVEVEWLIYICNTLKLDGSEPLKSPEIAALRKRYKEFRDEFAEEIKEIEKTTNHDVKAVEYFLQKALKVLGRKDLIPFIHFACTSEDINNLSYAAMLNGGIKEVMAPALDEILSKIKEYAEEFRTQPMMSHTHGQPATPTTVGKEFKNVGARLYRQVEALKNAEIFGKINGATGNYNAHVIAYPEVEWDWYTFGSLNMPKNHPARDEWETFFIENLAHPKYGEAILTPHTSSGQLREMERLKKPPIRMLNIAKCYRRQSDISHAPMFYQFEGLVIDKGINITHLKGTLNYFVKQYFGPERKTRIRPFHFQFTEPSFEVDVTCIVCGGKGCKVCKEGWMELGGSGMVHPIVLKNGGIDPQNYTGFAWGWGVERLLMMKHGIPDIRFLFNGDLRFLNQF